MMDKIKAVQYGCGPVGCAVVRLASKRRNIEMVGAVDIDPNKVKLLIDILADISPKYNVK